MSSVVQVPSGGASPSYVSLRADAPAVPLHRAEPDLAQAVRTALRGRYGAVIVLGLLGALLGGLGGWMLEHPAYTSEAVMELQFGAPSLGMDGADNPVDLERQEAAEQMREYVQLQQRLIYSRAALDLAMADPRWIAATASKPHDAYATAGSFANHITVDTKTGMRNTLRIGFTDSDPAVATAGASAIVRAYQTVYAQHEDAYQQHRLSIMQAQRHELAAQLDELQGQIKSLQQDVRSDASVAEVARLQQILTDLRTASVLAGAGGTIGAPPGAAPGAAANAALANVVDPMASADPVMRSYLDRRDQLEEQLEMLRAGGYGPNHPQVARWQAALNDANQRIARYEQLSAGSATGSGGAVAGGGVALPEMSAPAGASLSGAALAPDAADPAVNTGGSGLSPQFLASQPKSTLDTEAATLGQLYAHANAQAADASDKTMTLDRLKAEDQKLSDELAKLSDEMAMLPLQSALRGRVGVLVANELPLHPVQDRRLIKAGAGALFGALLPAAILVGFSTFSRRYRFPEEAEAALTGGALGGGTTAALADGTSGAALGGRVGLLGVLPELTERDIETVEGVNAAHCINQLRVMLQLGRRREGGAGFCFGVASASPGEGKTSVTAALGLAFAAAGAKTLLVDFDLVARHLTDSFSFQQEPGLCEALQADRPVLELVHPTPQSGLDLLPAGQEGVLHAGVVTGEATQRVLEELRHNYDVVLVDSGPVLGSVEASVVGPAVDAVLLLVSRGQQQRLVEQASQHLANVGAPLAGLVFNRAGRSHFRRSGIGSSQRSGRFSSTHSLHRPAATDLGSRQLADQLTDLGPLVRAVATYLPSRGLRRALPASSA